MFEVFDKEKIYAFGDSHLDILNELNSGRYFLSYCFDVTWVGGATAQGLVNPNSLTNCLEIFNEKIKLIENKESKLIFLLGELDTGFIIWYRANKYNESIEFQLNRSIKNYFTFLDDLKSQGFKNIYIVSAPLPTIKDDQSWGEVANLRKEIKATQKERTNLTLDYNSRLKDYCGANGFKFVDFDSELLDKESNL